MQTSTKIKNDLILRAARHEQVNRPPVWMMRQAGRYLPEYQAIRSQMSFLELCKNPKKAAEVSIQPFEILGVDAIIMFSDILVILEAMGAPLSFATGGPKFLEPVREASQVEAMKALSKSEIANSCDYVYETLAEIKSRVQGEVPVLGFAGAPWTLASYLIEGGGSKDFAAIKGMMYQQPELFHSLLSKIADVVADYLILKAETGADMLQLFDTWASSLSIVDYQAYALPYQQQIIAKIKAAHPDIPVTIYVNGVAHVLDFMIESGADVVSVDWRVDLAEIRSYVSGASRKIAVQGNFDPCYLLGSRDEVIRRTEEMLAKAGPEPGYIANLGHGILPMVPVENARAFIDTVKSASKTGF